MLTPAYWETQPDSNAFAETLDDVLGTAARLFNTRLVAVSRVEGVHCTLVAVIDHQRQIQPGLVLPLNDTFCSAMLEHNAPLHLNNISALPNAAPPATNPLRIPIEAYLGSPLRLASGRVWGSLWTVNTEPYPFTANDVRMISLLARSLTHELETVTAQQHRKRIEQLQATRMDIDPLTGVLGHDGFHTVLNDQAIWRQGTSAYTVAVIKLEPDTNVHGDVVHQGLADMVMRTIRLTDYCGRIDTTTYAVLLPNTTRDESETWQQRLSVEVDTWNRMHRVAGLAFEIELVVAQSSEVAGGDEDGLLVLQHARQQLAG